MTDQLDIPAQPETKPTSGPTLGAWLAVAVTLGGPLAYMALIDVPWIRETAAPAFVLILVGLAIGAWMMRSDSRCRVRLPFGVSALLAGLFCFGFFVMTAVPQATALADMTTAPPFRVQDHSGADVSLQDELAKGPVLLVFYRGHW